MPYTATIITLAEVKGHLRLELDETYDDVNLTRFMNAADEYVKSATGFAFADPSKVPYRAKQAALMLVEHWDKNRGVQVEGMTTTAPLAYAVSNLLAQLTYTYIEV